MKFYDGKIPEAQINGTMRTWVSEVNDRLTEYNLNLAENRQRDALRNILAISRLGNQLIQIWQPWVKVKKPETKKEADACVMLAGLVFIVRYVFVTSLLCHKLSPSKDK